MHDPTAVGPTLRRLRVERDIALTAVAAEAGVSVATLSRIETNKQSIDVGLLLTLARIIGVPVADVLGSAEEHEDLDGLSRRLAALPPDARAKVLRQSLARRKTRDLQPALDELIATAELMREELLHVQRALGPRAHR